MLSKLVALEIERTLVPDNQVFIQTPRCISANLKPISGSFWFLGRVFFVAVIQVYFIRSNKMFPRNGFNKRFRANIQRFNAFLMFHSRLGRKLQMHPNRR